MQHSPTAALSPIALFAADNLAILAWAKLTHIRNPRLDALKDPRVANTAVRAKALCGRDVFNPSPQPFSREQVTCTSCLTRYDRERPQ